LVVCPGLEVIFCGGISAITLGEGWTLKKESSNV